LHQFPAFPNGGNVTEIGEGKGEGFTINTALPPGSGDEIYMDAINMFMPVAEQFNPDVVAVSAGFDAHLHDLLLDMRLSANTYFKIGQILGKRFKNIFATLEGGYNTEFFPKCLYNFLDGINGLPQKYKEPTTDSRIIAIDEFEGRAALLRQKLSKFWKL
jgi:acetoin utilization deacetylase AcuC-like enzyme